MPGGRQAQCLGEASRSTLRCQLVPFAHTCPKPLMSGIQSFLGDLFVSGWRPQQRRAVWAEGRPPAATLAGARSPGFSRTGTQACHEHLDAVSSLLTMFVDGTMHLECQHTCSGHTARRTGIGGCAAPRREERHPASGTHACMPKPQAEDMVPVMGAAYIREQCAGAAAARSHAPSGRSAHKLWNSAGGLYRAAYRAAGCDAGGWLGWKHTGDCSVRGTGQRPPRWSRRRPVPAAIALPANETPINQSSSEIQAQLAAAGQRWGAPSLCSRVCPRARVNQ